MLLRIDVLQQERSAPSALACDLQRELEVNATLKERIAHGGFHAVVKLVTKALC
jgi:hypothetical protein